MKAGRTISPPRDDVQDAFNVHSALIVAEASLPWLRDNPRWRLLRFDAYETFHNLFTEAEGGR